MYREVIFKTSMLQYCMIKKQILILENSQKNFDVLDGIFKEEEFVCVSALDETSFKTVKIEEFDLVLVNVRIPFATAKELINLAHTEDVTTKIPVVYLDNGKEHDRKRLQECFDHGVSEYIKKPFDKYEILSRVKYHYMQSHKMKEYKLRVDKLGRLATIDQLSKSSSKMHMQAILKHQVNAYKRYKIDTSIIYLSLLNVDKTAKMFGFEYGEKIISTFSKELRILIRDSDVLARWVGGEFLILLTNSNIKAAEIVVQKLKSKLANIEFMKGVKPDLAFGITTLEADGSVEEVLQRAKYALEEAKRQTYGKVAVS